MLHNALGHAVVFVFGALFGAFALRRNPIKGAKTLAELDKIYADVKAKLASKPRK